MNGASYEWTDAVPANAAGAQCQSDRRWLVPHIPSRDHLKSYRPLVETPALFKTFVDLEPTEDAFRGFSNRFGQLGTQELALIGSQVITGISLSRFVSEHSALKQVVGMLDVLNRRPELRVYAKRISDQAIQNALLSGDVPSLREASTAWVQLTTNLHLCGRADVGDPVVTVLERDSLGKLRLAQTTQSLLGVLWLQCARAAEGDQVFKQCEPCRDWFLVSPQGGGKRRQAIYCSPRCKVRAHRKK